MKKILLSTIILLISNNLYSQILLEPSVDNPDYEKIKKFNDSISQIRIKADTITKYKIDKIVENETFYIIYAKGIAKDGNNYLYRIKSDKSNCAKSCIPIKEGEIYQLDLRDYRNFNQRLHFISGISFNLITHSGFSPFDIVLHLDEKLTADEFNIALNLKGLCIIN